MDKVCEICGNKTNLSYFPTDGYIENPKTFLSGGFYLCKKCLSICKKCNKCNKLIASKTIKPLISGIMKTHAFCECEKKSKKEHNKISSLYNSQQKELQTRKNNTEQEKRKNKVKNFEKQIIEIEASKISEFILTIGCDYYILDTHLSSIFEISTQELRNIIHNNLDYFNDEELYQISDIELLDIENELENYITTINPYAFNINGVIKLSYHIKNEIAKQFANNATKCLLENKHFITKNKNIQTLYNIMTDNYHYKSIKENQQKTQKLIEEMTTKVNELKKTNDEYYNKINLLKTIIFCIIICILYIIKRFIH